jgi:hypothetical protein
MDEVSIAPFLKGLFNTLEMWKTEDLTQIAPSSSKSWLRLVAQKVEIIGAVQ